MQAVTRALVWTAMTSACGHIGFGDTCIAQLSAAGDATCVARSDGTMLCWGGNGFGELGNASTVDAATPSRVLLPGPVAAIGAGEAHTCAALGDGSAYCWGHNDLGEVGDGTMGVMRTTPTLVKDLADVVELSTGQHHTCARVRDGSVWCWGDNSQLELGTNTALTVNPDRGRAELQRAATHITTGDWLSCAVLDDETLQCWGSDNPVDPTTTVPVGVPALAAPIQVAGGCDHHACAVLSDGSVWCWGTNGSGQLGDGTMTTSMVPVNVAGLGDAVGVAVGSDHSCARLRDGSVWCWGANYSGQLGGPAGANMLQPVQVQGIPPADDLVTGCDYSCIRSASEIWCWGDNSHGALGDGTMDAHDAPVLARGVCGS